MATRYVSCFTKKKLWRILGTGASAMQYMPKNGLFSRTVFHKQVGLNGYSQMASRNLLIFCPIQVVGGL